MLRQSKTCCSASIHPCFWTTQKWENTNPLVKIFLLRSKTFKVIKPLGTFATTLSITSKELLKGLDSAYNKEGWGKPYPLLISFFIAMFQQLTVKAFLAIRPYAEQIISTVELMLGTGLPSFKGEATIKRLRDRFVLNLNERQAAEWMMSVIKNAHENMRSIAYDEFQRVSAKHRFHRNCS